MRLTPPRRSGSSGSTAGRRALLADAGVELVCGVGFVAGGAAAAAGTEAWRLPAGITPPLCVGFGLALFPVAGVLWRLADSANRELLLAVAAGNAVTAAAGARLLRADQGVASRRLLRATVLALSGLAVTEAAAARAGS